ncbi:hypothetical protein ACFQX7_23345 [Luedemannella flava]
MGASSAMPPGYAAAASGVTGVWAGTGLPVWPGPNPDTQPT